MDRGRWRLIEDLYHSVLQLQAGQRSAFLAQACEGDQDLRHQLDLLLSQSDSGGELVSRPVWELVSELAQKSDTLRAGTRFGPYEILLPLGEGGMGKVYRALDTRLDRAVAIKISTEQFSARFEREARAIAALNHPNICTLYDVGPNYLVMELVEGETLDERVERVGPLAVEDVLKAGLQVVEALEAAHLKGIIHRDLKPANIKIRPDGVVKVLDFGLAKNVRDEREANASRVADLTVAVSMAGQLIGTPVYMSPEQARGQDVDARTDVWAFGCLIYELLTGTHAFGGETCSEIVACILEREPDWEALPADTPVQIVVLLRQCLEKDPVRRLQGIGSTRSLIESARRPVRTVRVRQVALLIALAAAAGLAVWSLGVDVSSSHQPLHAVPLTTFLGSQDWPSFSPDGTQLAFSWDGENQDNFDIYVKRIGAEPLLRLTLDSAEETNPSWSPDGRSIAFLRSAQPGRSAVVLIPQLGGPERTVGEVTSEENVLRSLTWSPDGKWLVVFDRPRSEQGGLWLLSPQSGERHRLTWSLGSRLDKNPAFSPDGRLLAFARMVGRNEFDLYFVPLGQDLRPRGEPRRLAGGNFITGLAWSADGRELIYSSGPVGNVRLFRMPVSNGSRPKELIPQGDVPGDVLGLALAPGAKRLVFVQSRREMDIYRAELSNNGSEAHGSIPLIASSRLERFPKYSPDGRRIAFVSLRSGDWQLWVSNDDGTNATQMTSFENSDLALPSWTGDGRQIGFICNGEAYVIDAAGGKPHKLENLGNHLFGFSWSRDGRWIFFLSSGSGTEELWRIPSTGGVAEQLTLHGAYGGRILEPPASNLLYYVRPGAIYSVPLTGGDERQLLSADINPSPIEADRRGIYFVGHSGRATANGDLMFYPFPNGPITKVAGVKAGYGLSVSPDERHLLYTKMTSTGSDLMLVENFR